MAATFEWDEANGVSQGTTHNRTECNWKNIDDSTTAYSSSPITAGNNSFDKWQFGHFSGTYNQILSGLFAHTSGTIATANMTLKGQPTMTADANRLAYATPSVSTNANLTFDQSGTIDIASGRAVWFGADGPGLAGKAASMTTNPCYTNFLTSQLQTTGSAAAGDTNTLTLTLRYNEN